MMSSSCLCSASGASVVAIDNKIEQAMVSTIIIIKTFRPNVQNAP